MTHLGRDATKDAIVQEVAVLYADRFEPTDRVIDNGRPHWQQTVLATLGTLSDGGLIEILTRSRLRLTGDGISQSDKATKRLAADATTGKDDSDETAAVSGDGEAETEAETETEKGAQPGRFPALISGVISLPLRTHEDRERAGVADVNAMPVMIELNLRYDRGPRAAMRELSRLWRRVTGQPGPERLTDEYATGVLTLGEMKRLVAADAAPMVWTRRTIYRIWPDFAMNKLIDASVVTVKADAAQRSFNSYGDGVVWAVVDSGIDREHPHFKDYKTVSDASVVKLHRSFLPPVNGAPDDPLIDTDGHGTHVAGIIAGGLRLWKKSKVVVTENRFNVDNPQEPLREPRKLDDPNGRLNGMAPRAKLVSLKVLGGGGTLENRVSRVIQALAYVREVNAESDKLPRIHGVNLSVGYDFDPTWFACGQSPLCQEVDKLVRTGVVVVVAAGNSGYGTLNPKLSTVAQFGLSMTINDPGNAERAITVGATHRDSPHMYGVSYFSSKGPTGDGRRKPDLVAPGERITSAAAGDMLAAVSLPAGLEDAAVYVEDSGTSMAAPHVSGVVAAFLSVRHEFIGRPEEVKRIFVDSATPLGRDPNFEGSGLVDLMRALQSV